MRLVKEKFEAILEVKDETIKRLEEEIKVLIAKLPEINLKDFSFKEIEVIQKIIKRMVSNFFILKGCAITIVII